MLGQSLGNVLLFCVVTSFSFKVCEQHSELASKISRKFYFLNIYSKHIIFYHVR